MSKKSRVSRNSTFYWLRIATCPTLHFSFFPEHHNLSQVKENIAWNGEILKDYLFIYQKY